MHIECPECNATVSLDDFLNFPAEHVCDECGACFDLESHLIFDEKSFGADEESEVPLGD
jgi:transcription initiation factor TFIIIB Brf1 subunit/transcription initiation factor TFIIB